MRLTVEVPEFALSVIGDVVSDGAGVHTSISTIRETDTGVFWSADDIAELEPENREVISEALLAAYDEAMKHEDGLIEMTERICALMKTYVRLAVDSGTPEATIRTFLDDIYRAVLSSRRATR